MKKRTNQILLIALGLALLVGVIIVIDFRIELGQFALSKGLGG